MTTAAPPRPPRTRRAPQRSSRKRLTGLARGLAKARSSRRLSLILALYLLVTSAVTWRLVMVQVVDADRYRGLAAAQTHREIALPAQRGSLYDRAGEPLALSLTAATIYANPRQITDAAVNPDQLAGRLAPVLDMDVATVREALVRDTAFTYVARQLPREVGDQVKAMIANDELPGIGVVEEPRRVYPAGDLGKPVIGLAGIDHVGLAGLELQYDEVLAGQPGTLRFERAPGGVTISATTREVSPPVPGSDLVLTLDREIQAAAELALSKAVEDAEAAGGAALVLDAQSGELLASAAMPAVDGVRAGRHRAVTDVYEPGSVNKVITIAGALEDGLVTPSTVLEVPPTYRVANKTFSDAHEHPIEPLTVTQIMEQSSNVGTIQIAERLGAQRLHEWVSAFGYGRPTGLNFPGESGGLLPEPENWSATSLPTIAIGYGVAASLLQVANVFATIANDGEWISPSLVRGITDDSGFVPAEPAERRRVVSPETAAQVAGMLLGVVEDDMGTGAAAGVRGYRVAGKTGTARKPSEDGGYEPGAYIASFAGYAPAENPQLVVAVMIDEPRHGFYGGTVAAPVFSEIMGFALAHQRVAPSEAVEPAPATVEEQP